MKDIKQTLRIPDHHILRIIHHEDPRYGGIEEIEIDLPPVIQEAIEANDLEWKKAIREMEGLKSKTELYAEFLDDMTISTEEAVLKAEIAWNKLLEERLEANNSQWRERIARYLKVSDEYQSLLGCEIHDLALAAVPHGWKSKRYEEGEALRKVVEAIRKELLN